MHFQNDHVSAFFILLSAINQGINSGVLPYFTIIIELQPDTYSQISGGPGAVLEFLELF